METKTFKTIDGIDLIIINKKSSVIFEVNVEENSYYDISLFFGDKTFQELLEYMETNAKKIWGSITLKEATSMGSDYAEYYDKELDNNGYLSIRKNALCIERPSLESNRIYRFNKGKMQSFLYDFRKIIKM